MSTTVFEPERSPSRVNDAAAERFSNWHWSLGVLAVTFCAVILGCGIVAAASTSDGSVSTVGPVRLDALSAVFVMMIGAVGVVAMWPGARRTSECGEEVVESRRCSGATVVVVVAAVTAVCAGNLGSLWVSIVTMTVGAALSISTSGTPSSREARWKYSVLSAVGLALSCAGTGLIFLGGGRGAGSLDISNLMADHTSLDAGAMRTAFALILLGFAATAGLFPFHTWVSDVHIEAPAPTAALMSGVVMPVGVYALLRYHSVLAPVLDAGYVRAMLAVIAVATLAVSVSMLLAQRDFRRLLAISSVQYTALSVFGLAIGNALVIAAVLLHLLGHGVLKAVLFCGADHIADEEGSTAFADLHGLMGRDPALAGITAFALAGVMGFPPFSPFVSTHTILAEGLESGLAGPAVVVAVLCVVSFVAIAARTTAMFFGASPSRPRSAVPHSRAQLIPSALALMAVAAAGVVSGPVDAVLRAAGSIVSFR